MLLACQILLIAVAACAVVAEFSRTLMMVQQNSYRIDRYNRYLNSSGESTSMSKMLSLLVLLAPMVPGVSLLVSMPLVGVFCLCMLLRQWQLQKTYKHPVVWTPRVKRLFGVMVVEVMIAIVVALLLFGWRDSLTVALVLLAAWICSPALAKAAISVLGPVEKRINQGFIDDAAQILRSMPDLKIIGITGSYGKTSTKHYLARILAEKYAVCMTPGSFNTTLGVVRTVREHLKPFDQVFICEMGAKQIGDIKEICDLVHPSIGIVTAVGPQHLESFKSIENVRQTKFELVDSLPASGLAVLNNDFEFVANRPVDNVAAVRYGITTRPDVSFSVKNIHYSASGTDFVLLTPDGDFPLHTRLVGECNVSNLVAAVIVALHLGVDRHQIAYAVEQIEQVEHRLSIKRTPGGLTIIDDAFNSNPTGSAMALDVLAAMTPGKRIVITPGMIELGEQQERLNSEFGEKIARCVDVAIIVGQYNRDAILQGIGEPEGVEIHVVDSFAQAQTILTRIARRGDTVLYENDLPDTFK